MKPLAGTLGVPGILSALGSKTVGPQSDGPASRVASEPVHEKTVHHNTTSSLGETSDDESVEKIDTNAEYGVQAVQAMTFAWSKNEIIFIYIM